MKKTFANIRTLAALLIASAALAACSNDDGIVDSAQPDKPSEKVYTLTINALKDAAATRALSLDGANLVAKWVTDDVVWVYKAENRNQCNNETLLGHVSPIAGSISTDGQNATFSGTIEGASVGDKLLLVYHADAFDIAGFEGQDGTLTDASALDCATAAVTVAAISGSDIIISETSATFSTHTAMLKLTLTTDGVTKINPTQLKVNIFSYGMSLKEFVFSPTAATYTANGDGILYFALPNAADVAVGLHIATSFLEGATVTYTATVGSNTYTATKTGYTFTDGTYYAGTLTMTKLPPLNLTNPAVGQVIGSDGKNYAASTVPSGVTKVAMIACVDGTHGLALALQDADSADRMSWNDANTFAMNATPKFSNATWRLPTYQEWLNIFGKNENVNTIDSFDSSDLPIFILGAGGDNFRKDGYWSGGGSSGMAWALIVSTADESLVRARFEAEPWELLLSVRLCLAF